MFADGYTCGLDQEAIKLKGTNHTKSDLDVIAVQHMNWSVRRVQTVSYT